MSEQLHLDETNLPAYLLQAGVVSPGETVSVEPAGAGNINWVRRARSSAGPSWVVKQARPALERFPEYRVSTRRIVFEARYYETVAPFDRAAICPRVVRFDPRQRVLVLDDDVTATGRALGAFLGAVHAGTRPAKLAGRFDNDEMRRLHGDHIFHLPYRANDFPLSPAVRREADSIRRDAKLVRRIDAAHARYLEPRGVLVHGDVQPANVPLTAAGPKLLDAEIAHVGDPAFDVGQLVGHLLLPAVARGEPAAAAPALEAAWSGYVEALAGAERVSFRDVARYAGIELLRRTIGAARVAAVGLDEASLAVVAQGIAWIETPPDDPRGLVA
jgi:5-methylthioribose kinase